MRHSRQTGPMRRRREAGIPCRMTSWASLPAASASTRASPAAMAGSRSARSCARASRLGVALGARLPQAGEPAARAQAGDADLVAAVLPVVDHRVGHDGDAAADRRDDREPLVVHPARRERRGTLHERARRPSPWRRSRRCASAAPRRATTRAVRARRRRRRASRTGSIRAARPRRRRAAPRPRRGRAGPGRERGDRPRDAIGMPDVVLVAQGDQVAGCRAQRLLEVGRSRRARRGCAARRASGVAASVARRRRSPARASSTVPSPEASSESTISSTGGLPEDALELLAEESRAVVGAERDGDRGAAVAAISVVGGHVSTPRNMPAMIVCAPRIISSAAGTAVRTVSTTSSAPKPAPPTRRTADADHEPDEEEGEAHERAALEADASSRGARSCASAG